MNELPTNKPENAEAIEEKRDDALAHLRFIKPQVLNDEGILVPEISPSAKRSAEVEKEITALRTSLRAELTEQLEATSEGNEFAYVNSYLEQLGLPTRPAIVASRDKINELDPELLSMPVSDPSAMGYYLNDEDLAIVIKDPHLDQINLVHNVCHEKVHEAGINVVTYASNDQGGIDYIVSRAGFVTSDGINRAKGCFFEEGIAELVAANFDELRGISREGIVTLEANNVSMSTKYYRNGTISWSSIAATGLELLAIKRPELIDTMLDARTDAAQLERVKDIVDDIHPGLYEQLDALPNGQDSLAKGLNLIVGSIWPTSKPDDLTANAGKIAGTRNIFLERLERN